MDVWYISGGEEWRAVMWFPKWDRWYGEMERRKRNGNFGGSLLVSPRNRTVSPILVLLVLLGVVFWSGEAPADGEVSGSGVKEGTSLTERIALLEEALEARNEGERLEALGAFRKALVLYERSLALFADPVLAARAASLRERIGASDDGMAATGVSESVPPASPEGRALKERMERLERALTLRKEGENAEEAGRLSEALAAYRESLALFADPSLAERVERLEALSATAPPGAPVLSSETGIVEAPPSVTATPVSSGESEDPLPTPVYAEGAVLLETSVPEGGTTVHIPEGPVVTVPAGALSSGVSLRVARAEAAPVPLLAGEAPLLGAWKFDAGGGLFDRPVEMSLALPAVEDLSELRLVLPVTSRDGRDWTVLPYRRENDVLYFQATHFSIIGAILIGTLIGGGVVIPLVRAPTELPQYFQEDAPFVKFLAPDPEGIDLSWSHKLGDGTTGLKDKAAFEKALQLAWEEHMQRVRDISAMRDRELARAREANLGLAAQEKIRAETLRLAEESLNAYEKARFAAFERHAVPDEVLEIRRALSLARTYLLGTTQGNRGFVDPGPVDVYVTNTVAQNDGETVIRWVGVPYLILWKGSPRDDLYVAALHEYFHHVQRKYFADDNRAIFLSEASAVLLEREAKAAYAARAGVTVKNYLADMNRLKTGLDGPPLPGRLERLGKTITLQSIDAKPFQRMGYGLSWFLEWLLAEVRASGGGASPVEQYHNFFLASCRDAGGAQLPVDAFAKFVGGDRKKLGALFARFVKEAVLEGFPKNTLFEKKYGTSATQEITVFDPAVPLFVPLSFDATPIAEFADAAIKPWSFQAYALQPPKRPAGTPEPRLVLSFPAEWFDKSATDGRHVFLRERGSTSPRELVSTASGGKIAAAVSFDLPVELCLVDTGQTGSGWIYDYSPGRAFLLEPPLRLKGLFSSGTTPQESAVRLSWEAPPSVKAKQELFAGYLVEVFQDPKETTPLFSKKVPAEETSLEVPGGIPGLGPNKNALIRVRTLTAGDPSFASEPVETLLLADASKKIPFFGNRTFWMTASPFGNDPSVVLPSVILSVTPSVTGLSGSIDQKSPEWKRFTELTGQVAKAEDFLKEQMKKEMEKMGVTLNEAQMAEAMKMMQLAGVGLPETAQQGRAVLGSGYQEVGKPVTVSVTVSLPPIPRIPVVFGSVQDNSARALDAQLCVRNWFFTTGTALSPKVEGSSGTTSVTWTPQETTPDTFGVELVFTYDLLFFERGTGKPFADEGVPLLYRNFPVYFPVGIWFAPLKKQ